MEQVLGTIRSLQRSGDRITRIECALSGSINSLTSRISGGASLSDAVQASVLMLEFDCATDLNRLGPAEIKCSRLR